MSSRNTNGIRHAAGNAAKLQKRVWKRPLPSCAGEKNNAPMPSDLNLAIATIKASLGLSITDLSICLNTARQTIYAWIRKEHEPHLENIKRLTNLYQVAERWQALSQLPAKEYYTKIADLLTSGFDVDSVISTLEKALSSPITQPNQKTDLERLLEKHNIDTSALPSQDEQFDFITGKSNFFGDFDEPEN